MEVREASGSYVGLNERPGDAVPFGYTQTEVGVIPDQWGVKLLGDFYSFRNGVNADGGAYGRGVRFINVLEPITHSHLYGPEISGQVTLTEAAVSSYAVRRGDIVFNRTSETQEEIGLAASYLGSDRVVFGGFVIRGRPVDTTLDPNYAGYALRARCIRSQIVPMGQGAIRANISQSNLKEVSVPIPPMAEQRAIAEALSDADALIESLQQLIAKKRLIKQGTMQALLTGKQRLPGFSEKWAPKKIGDLLTIMHGKNQHAVEDENGGYPILATGGQIGSASSFLYDKPSVLIGRKGTIDRPQYMDKPFWSVDTLFYSVIHQPNVAKYVFYRFCLIDWRAHNEASGVPSLNARTIEQIELGIPPGDEQTAIATILTDMDSELAELETRLAKTRQLKQGMMQELLTGRIRLL